MAPLLSPGFGNQPVDVGLLDAQRPRPLRAIVQHLRSRTLFNIPPHGIAEHFSDTAVFRLRRALEQASGSEILFTASIAFPILPFPARQTKRRIKNA
jgi:hypothetical protein